MRWIVAGVMALLVWLGMLPYRPPAVVPASAPETSFSAERAMRHVRNIAQAPRPVGSAEHERVRDYLLGELRSLGAEPSVQRATRQSRRGREPVPLMNIVARLSGARSVGKAVLLAAHYDGSRNGPAAGDDAAGLAAVLETVRAIRAGPPPANDLIVLFTDGEELGLLGAAAFRHEHPWMADVALALNFEGRGTHGPSLMFETGPGNREVVRTFARAAPHAAGSSLAYTIYQLLPNDTDFSHFRQAGVAGLNFAFIRGVRHYHRATDTAERLDPRSVQHHGSSALALARHYLDSALPTPARESDGDAVFFNLPGAGLVAYSEDLARPLALVLAVMAVAGAVAALARGGASLNGLLIAHLALPGSLVAAVVGAEGTWWVIHRLTRGAGSANAGSDLGLAWFVVVSGVAAAAGLRVLRWARRWSSEADVRSAGAVAAASLALITAASVPGGSYAFTWPGFGAAAALFLASGGPSDPAGGGPEVRRAPWHAAFALAASAPALLIIPPLMVLVFDAMGLRLFTVAAFALLAALAVWWCEPVVGLVAGRPRPREADAGAPAART